MIRGKTLQTQLRHARDIIHSKLVRSGLGATLLGMGRIRTEIWGPIHTLGLTLIFMSQICNLAKCEQVILTRFWTLSTFNTQV